MTYGTQNVSARTSHAATRGGALVDRQVCLGPTPTALVPASDPTTAGSSEDANSGRPLAAAEQPSRVRTSRPKRWSVLDLIWAFGDYGSNWSATFKADSSVVVAAHDGEVLGQFVLDLTKAILSGLGWEFLSRHTRFDGCCYVVASDYQLIAGSEPQTPHAAAYARAKDVSRPSRPGSRLGRSVA
jgi:hypothetical protein